MKIHDLAGLSQPLTKLIEVTAQGLGAVSAATLTRRNADAKAYEIKAIAAAMAESRALLADARYVDGQVSVAMAPDDAKQALAVRTQRRLNFQSLKGQINVESIVASAADEISQVEAVSAEPVDPDWISGVSVAQMFVAICGIIYVAPTIKATQSTV